MEAVQLAILLPNSYFDTSEQEPSQTIVSVDSADEVIDFVPFVNGGPVITLTRKQWYRLVDFVDDQFAGIDSVSG